MCPALIATRPDALVHYGPTAAYARDNIRLMRQFLLAGIDVCSTAMTPWVWPTMTKNPPQWIAPITAACAEGEASCFTTGIDPGFANDLFPMTLMGLCGEVRIVRALEILDYLNYEGDYEIEMGIGRPPDFQALLETPDILVMSWGATVPMIAHAAGIELDAITTTWEKWVTPKAIRTKKGTINPGEVAAIHFTINGVYRGDVRIQLEHVNRVGSDAAPTGRAARATTSIAWRSRARPRSPRRPRSASRTEAAGTRRQRGASRRGSGPSTRCPT
jgi:4-hydroxy-tetrahydrodipicolinate reductase